MCSTNWTVCQHYEKPLATEKFSALEASCQAVFILFQNPLYSSICKKWYLIQGTALRQRRQSTVGHRKREIKQQRRSKLRNMQFQTCLRISNNASAIEPLEAERRHKCWIDIGLGQSVRLHVRTELYCSSLCERVHSETRLPLNPES